MNLKHKFVVITEIQTQTTCFNYVQYVIELCNNCVTVNEDFL